MNKRIAAVLTVVGVLATGACGAKDEGDETTNADTTVVQGTDVVEQPTTVPVTDTLVTTTTTQTDTIHGEVDADSMRDSVAHP
jgi:hypothetical protein